MENSPVDLAWCAWMDGEQYASVLERIIFSRYRRFRESGYLFECAFLQNIVEELMLFQQMGDEDILSFYQRLYALIPREHFRLLYLSSDKMEENIGIIREERSDHQGNQMWYSIMIEYLTHSPYGKSHGCRGFEDLGTGPEFSRPKRTRIRWCRLLCRGCRTDFNFPTSIVGVNA